jgi:hypothetical protein
MNKGAKRNQRDGSDSEEDENSIEDNYSDESEDDGDNESDNEEDPSEEENNESGNSDSEPEVLRSTKRKSSEAERKNSNNGSGSKPKNNSNVPLFERLSEQKSEEFVTAVAREHINKRRKLERLKGIQEKM